MRRTTFRLDDSLLEEAKAYAAEHGRSLNSVMEDALRQLLNRAAHDDERLRVVLPLSHAVPGHQPWLSARLAAGEGWGQVMDSLETEKVVERVTGDAAP
ncbi:hypothetical protein C1I98_29265 [Spongiactinospora gelatinilytica]|uniref:Ribbon-helix-helix protein CopG domain-containing protein n=1 Tax=Spongiactinospora gelatinilytica TaxID=2666298 RepID=A0A2W2F5X5_9ACTN|nr:ribbon-helix-helix protein, CopG family [Spongiactinospora gelatinilytica]PZG32526.1 hypothetical protein C1I98_29265 [Spongiactinospora gelatinilytica]